MGKIRVLVVDDSVVIRRLVSDVLAADPAIEVAGTAANGRIALEKIKQLTPDLVTLDVEMPEMDGVQALKELRKFNQRLPVIMFSTLTERGAIITMDALAAGASDYVTKPSNVCSTTAAMARVREELIPKVKALCGYRNPARAQVASQEVLAARPKIVSLGAAVHSHQRIEILAIGVSTGGPNALAEVIRGIPADFPVPIVIVQHMPPVFTRLLAERLSAKAVIPISEAVAGTELMAGVAWIAPGDFHMVLEKSAGGARIKLNQEQPENSCRPAVDPLFRSVAKIYRGASLGLILTGMGQDGLRGCQAISETGGQVLVQDEASSVVWGMPGFVARAGLAEKVLPLSQIAGEIVHRASEGRSRSSGGHEGLSSHGNIRR
jgi:two-component system, chemotaxis family, protein-glutamate methylesterase/glutaminase